MNHNFCMATSDPEMQITYYKDKEEYVMNVAYKTERIQYARLQMPADAWIALQKIIKEMLNAETN